MMIMMMIVIIFCHYWQGDIKMRTYVNIPQCWLANSFPRCVCFNIHPCTYKIIQNRDAFNQYLLDNIKMYLDQIQCELIIADLNYKNTIVHVPKLFYNNGQS